MASRVRFGYEGIALSKNGSIPFERIFSFPWMKFPFVSVQIVSVRESLVIFQGNELNIAVILGNGLLLVNVGGVLRAG